MHGPWLAPSSLSLWNSYVSFHGHSKQFLLALNHLLYLLPCSGYIGGVDLCGFQVICVINVEAPDHNQVLEAGWVMVKGCFLGKKKKTLSV